MIDVSLDFETYWDKDYRLDRMTTAEYVLDPRFEIIGVALRAPDGRRHWITGDANHVRAELLRLVPDWSAVRVIAHNARFEAAILEWRLGIKPAAYFCTMAGARPHILPYTRSVSLASVARYAGADEKGDYAARAAGKHRLDFSPEEMLDYGTYCQNDEKITRQISTFLFGILPTEEQEALDLTIKKFVRPKLRLNRTALQARLDDIATKKETLAGLLEARYGATLADIRSRPKFAKLLEQHGAEPPLKLNKKGNATFAFAKDDPAFKEMLAHPSEAVRELAAAKMAMSSTLEESRLKRLITLHDIKDGWLPVPLVYYGAHPGRLSGDDEINLQNLPRVVKEKKTGAIVKGHLRFAIEAPPGYSILAADYSNIEARIVATLAGEVGLREGFRAGRDIYSEFASKIYGREIHKDRDPKERFVGKNCILGLGYGMGAPKFALKCAQEGIFMEPGDAVRVVQLYRNTYRGIPQLWSRLEQLAIQQMLKPDSMFTWNGLIFAHERIILPNGMPLIYPNLKRTGHGLSFDSRFAGVETGNAIWGGTFLENVGQALARIIATHAELRLARRGLPVALQVHDELVWAVPTAILDRVKEVVAQEMTRPLEWMPDLPIAIEMKSGPTYGDAK